MDRKCVGNIVDAIKEAEDRLGLGIGLLTFDTWAKGIAAGHGDESQAKDQNAALANLRRVIDKVNVHIATIGHTGKDESRGERGSNAKLADVDLQVQISGDTIKSAIIKKANDQPEGLLTNYQLEPYEFGPDDDGDPFRTFIVSKDTLYGAAVIDRRLGDKQRLAVEALAEVVLMYGADQRVNGQVVKTVTVEQWRDELFRKRIIDPEAKNPRARLFEIRTALAAKHVIGVDNDTVWLASGVR